MIQLEVLSYSFIILDTSIRCKVDITYDVRFFKLRRFLSKCLCVVMTSLDLNLSDVSKSPELKKIQSEIKKKNWDLNLVDFGQGEATDAEVSTICIIRLSSQKLICQYLFYRFYIQVGSSSWTSARFPALLGIYWGNKHFFVSCTLHDIFWTFLTRWLRQSISCQKWFWY